MRTGFSLLHVDAMLLWMSDLDCRRPVAITAAWFWETSIGAAADHRPSSRRSGRWSGIAAQVFPASQAALQGSQGSVVAGLGGCAAFEPVSPLFLSMGLPAWPSMGECYYYPYGLGR